MVALLAGGVVGIWYCGGKQKKGESQKARLEELRYGRQYGLAGQLLRKTTVGRVKWTFAFSLLSGESERLPARLELLFRFYGIRKQL